MFPFLVALATVLLAVLAAGCGDDGTSSTTAAVDSSGPPATTASDDAEAEADETAEDDDPAASATSAGGEPTLKFGMDEFSFQPATTTAKAGTVTISASNDGVEPHELVLTKSGDAPSKLPTGSDGSVDEAQLDIPGEVEEVQACSSGSATVNLSPGKYVYFCNLPGHYASGMYGTLTVK
jgi:plastocyanin